MSALWMPSTWFPMSSCYLSPSRFCSLVSYSTELCNPTNTWACIYTQSCLYVLGGLRCKPLDALYLLILKKKRQNGLAQRTLSQPTWNVANFRYKSELSSMKRWMRTREIRSKCFETSLWRSFLQIWNWQLATLAIIRY